MMKPYALLLVALVFTACSPAQVVEVPTLLVLPTDIPTTGPSPTSTEPPILTPTDTPVVSETPTATINPAGDTANCDIDAFWNDAEPLLEEYIDTLDIAGGVSRVSLAPLLLDMRRLLRDYEDIEAPNCDEYLYGMIYLGMYSANQGMEAFAANEEHLPALYLDAAAENFTAALFRLGEYGIDSDRELMNMIATWGGDDDYLEVSTRQAISWFATDTPSPVPTASATGGPSPTPTPSSTPLPPDQQLACVTTWWPTVSGHVIAFRETYGRFNGEAINFLDVRDSLTATRDYFKATATPDCALSLFRLIGGGMDSLLLALSSNGESDDVRTHMRNAVLYFESAAFVLDDAYNVRDAGTGAMQEVNDLLFLPEPIQSQLRQTIEEAQ